MNPSFHFKQFTIKQDQCAMKVGTDGVLLGAWVDLAASPESILDIGSGTGLIALQLAQRSQASIIDGVEIDPQAHAQCVENFENSLWNDRLFCYHASIQEFTQELLEPYDLIVANPPYFAHAPNTDLSRDRARNKAHLSFESLISCSAQLLAPEGLFAIIIPAPEANSFITLAQKHQLFLRRICQVKGQPSSATKRCLLEFSFAQNTPVETSLVIENSRHNYTDQYIALVSEFYLKM